MHAHGRPVYPHGLGEGGRGAPGGLRAAREVGEVRGQVGAEAEAAECCGQLLQADG